MRAKETASAPTPARRARRIRLANLWAQVDEQNLRRWVGTPQLAHAWAIPRLRPTPRQALEQKRVWDERREAVKDAPHLSQLLSRVRFVLAMSEHFFEQTVAVRRPVNDRSQTWQV